MVTIGALTDPAKIATLKDPRACNDRLLKVVYWLHQTHQAGHNPQAILDASLVPQPRRNMVIDSLLRNLLIANRLRLLTPANLDAMKRGKSPIVTTGPYAGEITEVDHILPVAKFPQYGKEFWNLELMPQSLNRSKLHHSGGVESVVRRTLRISRRKALMTRQMKYEPPACIRFVRLGFRNGVRGHDLSSYHYPPIPSAHRACHRPPL